MSLCLDSITQVLNCCNANDGCQNLFQSTTEEEMSTILSLMYAKRALDDGPDDSSAYMNLLLSQACEGTCHNVVALLKVLNPCKTFEILSILSENCEPTQAKSQYYNDISFIFFMAFVLGLVVIVFILSSLFYKILLKPKN